MRDQAGTNADWLAAKAHLYPGLWVVLSEGKMVACDLARAGAMKGLPRGIPLELHHIVPDGEVLAFTRSRSGK